jgi:hypothetical protein
MLVNKKRKCIWAVLWMLCICLTASAQDGNPMFYSEVRLKHKPYTLQSLTEEIYAQSGITFSYNADKISPNTKIKIKNDKLTVAALLAVVKKKTDIGYKIISKNHIVYTEPGKNQKVSKPKKLSNKSIKPRKAQKDNENTHQPFSLKTYSIAKTSVIVESSDDANVVVVGDTGSVSAYYFNGGFAGGNYAGGNNTSGNNSKNIGKRNNTNDANTDNNEEKTDEDSDDGSWKNDGASIRNVHSNTIKKEDIVNFFKSHALFSAGLSLDEIYYCNPSIRVGFSFLYAGVSYNLGSIPSTRIGFGSSIKINDKWRVHFDYSAGPYVHKDYVVQTFDTIPPIDSFQNPTINETDKPLRVTSKLTRYSLGFNWDMGKGFSLEGAAVFNSLKTTYSSNSNPINFSDFLPVGIDADAKYYAIKPPYSLSNNYAANQSSNTKSWIGIQFTLFYTLKFLDRE